MGGQPEFLSLEDDPLNCVINQDQVALEVRVARQLTF